MKKVSENVRILTSDIAKFPDRDFALATDCKLKSGGVESQESDGFS
jgi:hypothetical protein